MSDRDPSLRLSAAVAGIGYVLTLGTALAQFYLLPQLVVDGDAAQTTRNIVEHLPTFNAAVLCFLINFIGDLVATWGLYYLLKPTSPSLSLLAAWARLVYTAVGIAALLDLVTVRALVLDYQTLFSADQLHVHVKLALDSFQYHFGFTMFPFGLYLVLLGYLMWKSRHLPKVMSVIILLDGGAWLVDRLDAYLFPSVHLGFLRWAFWGELVFMAWLLAWGSRLKQPERA